MLFEVSAMKKDNQQIVSDISSMVENDDITSIMVIVRDASGEWTVMQNINPSLGLESIGAIEYTKSKILDSMNQG